MTGTADLVGSIPIRGSRRVLLWRGQGMDLVERVLRRFLQAMEHDSPAALRKYLKEHPEADKANHTVQKKSPAKPAESKGKSRPGPQKRVDDWNKNDFKKFVDQMSDERRSFEDLFPDDDERNDIVRMMPPDLKKRFLRDDEEKENRRTLDYSR